MKKLLVVLMALSISMTFAANRVGPVSQYGRLQAGKIPDGMTNAGHGRIFGSCEAYKTTPVKVRGMSLYWSVHSNATEFYNEDAVTKMVEDMKIEIIRIPVATEENCWSSDCAGGYINNGTFQNKSNKENQQALVDKVVNAAVKNDIYVIIDWHSHTANNQLEEAKDFFQYMAKKYGNLDNVIFEIFNEPKEQDWNTIKTYADEIVTVIRNTGSDNLILVGSRLYDQFPNEAVNNPINDKNVAYTFHYYANSHCWNGQTSWGSTCEGNNAVEAIKAGLPVFVSEWGTGDADGGGTPDDYRNGEWQKWLDQYDLSAANWSASRLSEGTAAFESNSNRSNFYYTTSGNKVKGYLANNPSSYTACSGIVVSSSSTESSSASQEGSPLVDDFEDGNGIANTGLDDVWYAYTDIGDKGASTIGNDSNDDGYIVVIPEAAAGNSDYGAGLTGIVLDKGQNKNAPYVALGLDIQHGFDGCEAITYKYKGAAHSLKAVMKGDTEVDEDGNSVLTGWNRHKASKAGSTSWTTASITLPGDMAQESGWGYNTDLDVSRIVQLQWEVKSTTTADYLYIDDLKCIGMNIVPVVIPEEESSSSSKPISSSSYEESSSSHVNPSCEDGETIVAPGVNLICVDGVWSVNDEPVVVEVSSLLDDFENGDGVANTGDDDSWYAFTDVGDKGASTITNEKDSDGNYVVVIPAAAADGSEYGAGITGISLDQGENENAPYVSMGLNIAEGLDGCTEVYYKYRGATHNLKAVTKGDEEGELSGYDYHKMSVKGSSSWNEASVKLSRMEQEGWGETVQLTSDAIVALQWEVKPGNTTVDYGYLYIDDVHCIGKDIPLPVSSSSTEESSASASVCDDGEEIHIDNAILRCVDGAWKKVGDSKSSSSSAPAGSSASMSSSSATGTSSAGAESSESSSETESSDSSQYNQSSDDNDDDEGDDDDVYNEDDDDMAVVNVAGAFRGLSVSLQGKTLHVTVARAGLVKIQVFDMMGHAIERHSENVAAGSFAHTFGNMGRGAYLIRVQQGSMARTVRMLVR